MTSEENKPAQTNDETFPMEELKQVLEPTIEKPVPPYVAAFKVSEGLVVCARCGLPGGKLKFLDSKGKFWSIKTNTNLIKIADGQMIHDNSYVCQTAKDFVRISSKNPENSEPAPNPSKD